MLAIHPAATQRMASETQQPPLKRLKDQNGEAVVSLYCGYQFPPDSTSFSFTPNPNGSISPITSSLSKSLAEAVEFAASPIFSSNFSSVKFPEASGAGPVQSMPSVEALNFLEKCNGLVGSWGLEKGCDPFVLSQLRTSATFQNGKNLSPEQAIEIRYRNAQILAAQGKFQLASDMLESLAIRGDPCKNKIRIQELYLILKAKTKKWNVANFFNALLHFPLEPEYSRETKNLVIQAMIDLISELRRDPEFAKKGNPTLLHYFSFVAQMPAGTFDTPLLREFWKQLARCEFDFALEDPTRIDSGASYVRAAYNNKLNEKVVDVEEFDREGALEWIREISIWHQLVGNHSFVEIFEPRVKAILDIK